MDLQHYLQVLIDRSASDLFLSPGAPPNIKIDGHTRHLGAKVLSPDDVRAMANSVMNEAQRVEFEKGDIHELKEAMRHGTEPGMAMEEAPPPTRTELKAEARKGRIG